MVFFYSFPGQDLNPSAEVQPRGLDNEWIGQYMDQITHGSDNEWIR